MDASSKGPRRMRRATKVLGIVALGALVVSCGVLGNLHGNPGYAAFGSPGARETDRELAISIGPLPLKIARFATRDDPELAVMLRDLEAVRVYVYDVNGDVQRVNERLADVSNRLVAAGWNQVLAVREDGEHVTALVKLDKRGTLRGMAVVVQDGRELVLVNLIGTIRPEAFSALMTELDLDLPLVTVSNTVR